MSVQKIAKLAGVSVDTAKFAMFKDGAQIVHIVDAIIESAQQGKWISVK